jgi:DNA modification methylase
MLIQADTAKIPLPSKSIHCAIMSPPYWKLRSYAGDQAAGEFPMLGLEQTPQQHLSRMVQVFREIWRILRDDGVCWVNYGDCYVDGQLMMMPHLVALALQADGWYVREDMVWSKPNPMPETHAGWRWEKQRERVDRRDISTYRDPQYTGNHAFVGDDGASGSLPVWEYWGEFSLLKGSWRHSRSHEYVFMLAKQIPYYSNAYAVREEAVVGRVNWNQNRFGSVGDALHPPKKVKDKASGAVRAEGRNPRTVQTVSTHAYRGAHYATYPPALLEPLILATCPLRVCPTCGAPWAAVVEKTAMTKEFRASIAASNPSVYGAKDAEKMDGKFTMMGGGDKVQEWLNEHQPRVIGYHPTCACGQEDSIPGIVFDPFCGSGTTGEVAKRLGRRWVCMDLAHTYLDRQAKIRTGTGSPSNVLEGLPLFAQIIGGMDDTKKEKLDA